MTRHRVPQNTVLRVQQCQSIDAIEDLFLGLPKRPGSLDLSLPTSTRDAQFGAVGSLIQLIITWAKMYPDGHLLIHNTDERVLPTHIRNLSQTQHGLVALLASSHVSSANKSISLQSIANAAVLHVITQMRANHWGYVNGPELILVSADETTLRYLPQLYVSNSLDSNEVRSHDEFVDLAAGLIDCITLVHQRTVPLPATLKEDMGAILYELFKNTDKWARHEVDNFPIRHSVRGIRLEFTKRSTLRTSVLAEQHVQYVAKLEETFVDFDLLEIAVFDSGPGLAARALRRRLDDTTPLQEEYGGILQCLKVHATSSGKSHHGLGLMEVMRALTAAKAFLRIRTGRLALYRDFLSEPLASADDLHLNDWSNRGPQLTMSGRAEGLLMSILMPVSLGKVRK